MAILNSYYLQWYGQVIHKLKNPKASEGLCLLQKPDSAQSNIKPFIRQNLHCYMAENKVDILNLLHVVYLNMDSNFCPFFEPAAGKTAQPDRHGIVFIRIIYRPDYILRVTADGYPNYYL